MGCEPESGPAQRLIVGSYTWKFSASVTSTSLNSRCPCLPSKPFLSSVSKRDTHVVFDNMLCLPCESILGGAYPVIEEDNFCRTSHVSDVYVAFEDISSDCTLCYKLRREILLGPCGEKATDRAVEWKISRSLMWRTGDLADSVASKTAWIYTAATMDMKSFETGPSSASIYCPLISIRTISPGQSVWEVLRRLPVLYQTSCINQCRWQLCSCPQICGIISPHRIRQIPRSVLLLRRSGSLNAL